MNKSAENMRRGFVIAALVSGGGKTTIATAIMRALVKRGLDVRPFKIGPDYIDTYFHKIATGRESINLDAFFSGADGVKCLFDRYSGTADISVIEGVMGLFDGFDRQCGSTAHISCLIGLPVIAVIDASSAGYSLAAVLAGIKTFNPDISIAGVIFNKVSSKRHLSLLHRAAEDAGIRILGYIGRDENLVMPSRHLGLRIDNKSGIENFIAYASELAKSYIDIDAVCEIGGCINPAKEHFETDMVSGNQVRKRIAVAYDEAFNFIYPENIRSLSVDPILGGDIVKFSPINDKTIPNADFLYLPGGYPELFAEKLSANTTMRNSIREYIERGGYCMAECGGMLYLCKDIDGTEMCGILPITATMQRASLKLGYREVSVGKSKIRGHEFHYSKVIERGYIRKIGKVCDIKGSVVPTPIYNYKNMLASYTHLYFGNCNVSDLWKSI